MIIRDGRRQEHDLGPRLVWEFSMMKMLGATGTTGTGRWSNAENTVVHREPRPQPIRVYLRQPVVLDEPCFRCGGQIVTTRPEHTRFCSTKCRARQATADYKKRQREARRAA